MLRRCTGWSATSCGRGIAEGEFRADLDVDTDAAILMQTVLGAMRLRELGRRAQRRADRGRPHVHVLLCAACSLTP